MKTPKRPTQRKVTMMLPEELLEAALKASGETMTETVRQGLELIAASQAYSSLRSLRGKVKLDISVQDLRRDRNW